MLQYVSCLEKELESNVKNKKEVLEEVCQKMLSIQKLEEFLSQSIQNQKTVSDKMQELARNNMDLRIELRQMKNVEAENRELERRLIEATSKLAEENKIRFSQFESKMRGFYEKSMFYKEEQRDKERIRELEEKMEILERERNAMEVDKMEMERRSRASQIELGMLRMELEKAVNQKNEMEKQIMLNSAEMVRKLKISTYQDYQYLKEEISSQSKILGTQRRRRSDRLKNKNFLKNRGIFDSSFHEMSEKTADNIKNRIIPEETSVRKKNTIKRKKKRNRKKKKSIPKKISVKKEIEENSDDSDRFYNNAKYGLRKNIFDTMK